ncbi:MAG TPA: hypothetical protein VGH81_06600 [Rudaea sp.]|jgi:hypothetical protein
MGMLRLAAGTICTCLLFVAAQSTFAQSGLMPGNSPFAKCARVIDPGGEPRGGNFLPGKYFQIKARAYLDKGDTTGALSMFEHAAYYGNKDAQYDMAMMYLRGATKVPVDVPRGVAWLKLASQYHQSDAVKALKEIDSALSGEQRQIAAGISRQFMGDYAVATTQRRARLKYERERGNAVIEMAGGGAVCEMDGTVVDGSRYYAKMDEEYADYMSTMFGRVNVEPIEQVSPPSEKK